MTRIQVFNSDINTKL